MHDVIMGLSLEKERKTERNRREHGEGK